MSPADSARGGLPQPADDSRAATPWRIRPAVPADEPALQALPGAGAGDTAGSRGAEEPGEVQLVAEAYDSGRIDAALRLRPVIGLVRPRSWYHVGCTVHAAAALQLFHRQRTLMLGNDHTGASELAGLAWRRAGVPLEAQAAVLRLLVDAALLHLARDRPRFALRLVAELPGVRDAAGQWPFWQGLGRHFYAGDPRDAQARHGDGWPGLVAALLPRHPVLAAFLPEAAQAAIAQVAEPARVLLELLEAAGLRYGHHVRVHDGGPVLEADVDVLPGVVRARSWTVAPQVGADPHGSAAGAAPWLLLGPAGVALQCRAVVADHRLHLPAANAGALGVADGGTVWGLPR